jgi:hypothetical protein
MPQGESENGDEDVAGTAAGTTAFRIPCTRVEPDAGGVPACSRCVAREAGDHRIGTLWQSTLKGSQPFRKKINREMSIPFLPIRPEGRVTKGDEPMRVMVMVKANADTEAGVMPTEQELTEMGQFNEELVKAGLMQAGEGLHPSSKGKRVRFTGKQPSVIDGPFAETKELVAGFWIWKVKSMDEAVEWLKRAPFRDMELEVRPIFETEDFGAELTPELRAQEDRLREQVEAQNKKS